MNAYEIVKLLEDNGWALARHGKGSHDIYKKSGQFHTISVPMGGGKKPLKIGTENSILKDAGLKKP